MIATTQRAASAVGPTRCERGGGEEDAGPGSSERRASTVLALAASLGTLALPHRAHGDDLVVAESPSLVAAADPLPPAPRDAPPHANSDAEDPSKCLFLPEPDCRVSPVAEFSLQGGISDSSVGVDEPLFHGVGVLGMLVPVRGTRGQLHLGPEIDLGFDYAGGPTTAWAVSPKVRARWWVDRSLFVIEGGSGPVFERFAVKESPETGVRIGHEWDLAFGFAGVAGPFVTGVRMNLLAWAAVLASPILVQGI